MSLKNLHSFSIFDQKSMDMFFFWINVVVPLSGGFSHASLRIRNFDAEEN